MPALLSGSRTAGSSLLEPLAAGLRCHFSKAWDQGEERKGYSAPSWVCALFARLTPVPSSCPLQAGRQAASQPGSPAPGQMLGLRIDLTCDLGIYAQQIRKGTLVPCTYTIQRERQLCHRPSLFPV